MLKAWAPSMTSLRNTKHANYQLQNGRMCCGWVFKYNAQGFQKMDKLSSTALKNKPLFKEWLVRIKKENLLKFGQYQICLEHFENWAPSIWHKPPKAVFRTRVLFVNKSVEREGAMLFIQEPVDLPLCLNQNNMNRLYRNQAFRCHLSMQLASQQNTKQMK